MKIFILIILLCPNICFLQMEDYNRLRAATEIDFGYHDKVYPDTFYVNSLDTETHEVYFVKIGPNNTDRIAYRKTDSTTLSGTVILQNTEKLVKPNKRTLVDRYSQRYSFMTMLFEDGQMVRNVNKEYIKSSTAYFKNDPCEHQDNLFDHKKNGYHLWQISGDQYLMSFHPDGSVYKIEFTGHNQGSHNSLHEVVKLHRNGQLEEYQVTNGTISSWALILNELGDTIYMKTTEHSKLTGLQVQMINEIRKGFKLYTTWENDSLLAVGNSTILFVDHKNKVINEEMFCQLVDRSIYDHNWVFRSIPEDLRKQYNLNYVAVFSPKSGRDYYFLKSEKDETNDVIVIRKFLKKNKKRIAALNED